jgi:enamine deaminase RidA (YjgF/YER057c/UK114 family)
MFKAISFPDRPIPTGYSNAIEVTGGTRALYIAGQVGRGSDGLVPPDIAGQTRNVIDNLRTLLALSNMTFENVAKFTVFLTDEALLPEFIEIWYPELPSPPPAVTGVIVNALVHPSLLVEIEGIAIA